MIPNNWTVERIGRVVYVHEIMSDGEALRAESDGNLLYTDFCDFPVEVMVKFLDEVNSLRRIVHHVGKRKTSGQKNKSRN